MAPRCVVIPTLGGQRQRDETVLKLDDHVLLALVHPARHPVARHARNLHRPEPLPGPLVDRKYVRGIVARAASGDEHRRCDDHRGPAGASAIDLDPLDALQERNFWTLGAGLVLDETVRADLAYTRGAYEQAEGRGEAELRENVTINRVFLGVAYEF